MFLIYLFFLIVSSGVLCVVGGRRKRGCSQIPDSLTGSSKTPYEKLDFKDVDGYEIAFRKEGSC